MRLTPEKVRAVRREFRAEEARLVALDARRRAEKILRGLKRDPDATIARRRADLLDDLRRLHRKRRRARLTRQAGGIEQTDGG